MHEYSYSHWPPPTYGNRLRHLRRRMRGGYGYRFKETYEAYGTGYCRFSREELSPRFSKEVLEGISTAAHITTFANRVAFVKTLQ